MKSLFTRSGLNPILSPGESEWRKIYNPGAALDENGVVHLFPRVQKENKKEDWHSRIGHATSGDGEHFDWKDPVLVRENMHDEKRGLEDPRVTKIEDTFYMTYAAYDGKTPRLCSAQSGSLDGPWLRQGPMLEGFDFFGSGGRVVRFVDGKSIEKNDSSRGTHWSKSGALFPEKIDGKFILLFGEFYMWLAMSRDGIHFEVKQLGVIGPRKGTNFFDNVFVEMGPPPILTEKGWLVLYHGVNEKFQYQIGFLLLDREDPRKILYRSDEPIFGPKEDYELTNDLLDVHTDILKPQVTFCCGAVVRGEMLWIYYGAGDATICTAWAPLRAILDIAP